MNDFFLNQYAMTQKQALEEKERKEALIRDFSVLENIQTIDEAKQVISSILNKKCENSNIYVDDTCFTVTCLSDSLRVCIDGKNEFICYVFE